MEGVFYLPAESYTEGLNPLKAYLKQLSFYIQNRRGCSVEEGNRLAITFLKKHFKDKEMKCFERLENGDRVALTTTLYGYIKKNLADGNVLAPTLTSYMPRSKQVSILSDFIFVAVKKRSKAKGEMHRAKAVGDMVLYDNKNNEQNNMKTYCNSMSGSFAQEACILHNPSNHSTLTSLTRTMTSLSNANNERLIAGNRYYPRGIDVLNNIVYITSNVDVDQVEKAVVEFELVFPTVEQTVAVLKRSSDLYFRDNKYYQEKIIPLLRKLRPGHLAAVCYIGDFYHLRALNPDVIRTLLDQMAAPVVGETPEPDIEGKLYAVDENIRNLAHHIFFSRMVGKGKDYAEMEDPQLVMDLYSTSKHIEKVLMDYKLFFNAFFMTSIFPPNVTRLKNMRRRAVVLSDTDSTCFTTDEWVTWYNGSFHISDKTIGVATSVAFVTTQSIVHMLRILSRNLNVDQSLITRIGMKNEFLWLAHAPADVSKHYFAYTVSCEMSIHKKPEIEVKGVHLKNSAAPKFVIDDAAEMMEYILTKVATNQKCSLTEQLNRVITLENTIRTSVLKAEPVFLKRSKIKDQTAYTQPANVSPYARHTFWNQVFGPTYGAFSAPPYSVVKIPTTLTNKTRLMAWVESFDNPELKARLVGWLAETGKKNLPTVYMHSDWVLAYGIPKELIAIIDVRRIILDVTTQHRLVLETFGVMLYKEKLVSEQFTV